MALFECKGCRQRKELVKHIKGLGYCQSCADKAPKDRKEFDEYIWPDARKSNVNWKPKHRKAKISEVFDLT